MWPGTWLTRPPPSGAPASLGPRAARWGEKWVKQSLRPLSQRRAPGWEASARVSPHPAGPTHPQTGLLNLKTRVPGFLHSLVIFKSQHRKASPAGHDSSRRLVLYKRDEGDSSVSHALEPGQGPSSATRRLSTLKTVQLCLVFWPSLGEPREATAETFREQPDSQSGRPSRVCDLGSLLNVSVRWFFCPRNNSIWFMVRSLIKPEKTCQDDPRLASRNRTLGNCYPNAPNAWGFPCPTQQEGGARPSLFLPPGKGRCG